MNLLILSFTSDVLLSWGRNPLFRGGGVKEVQEYTHRIPVTCRKRRLSLDRRHLPVKLTSQNFFPASALPNHGGSRPTRLGYPTTFVYFFFFLPSFSCRWRAQTLKIGKMFTCNKDREWKFDQKHFVVLKEDETKFRIRASVNDSILIFLKFTSKILSDQLKKINPYKQITPHTHAYTHTRTCHTHTRTCAYTHASKCAYTHTHMCLHTHMRTQNCPCAQLITTTFSSFIAPSIERWPKPFWWNVSNEKLMRCFHSSIRFMKG